MKNTSKKLNRIIGAIVLFLAAVFLLTGCFRNPPASSPGNQTQGSVQSSQAANAQSTQRDSAQTAKAGSKQSTDTPAKADAKKSTDTPAKADAKKSTDAPAKADVKKSADAPANADRKIEVTEDGIYTSKDEVAAYIHKYGTVPSNFLTKSKAKKLGWNPSHDTVDEVLPGYSIGGGGFANAEGLLPEAPGREYFECDIDYHGGKRNAKRIVYSNDGLIFYTDDHYESFERLY